LVRGALKVNGQALQTGDAAVMADEAQIELSDAQGAEVLVFDLAA
jgi:redox-sensitive bicupin YhaK (pirin superfamily)